MQRAPGGGPAPVAEVPVPGAGVPPRTVGERDRERRGPGRVGGGEPGLGSGRRRRPIVAVDRPSVGEGLARDGQEPPVRAGLVQRQPEHPVGVVVAHQAVGAGAADPTELLAPGADDDLGEAVDRVRRAGRVLGGEPLVVVVVAVEHQLRTGVVEVLPELRGLGVVAVRPRAEPGVVPHRQRAPGPAGLEVPGQPADLGRPRPAAADEAAVAVQQHHVPGPDVQAAVGAARAAGSPAEEREVRRGGAALVLVVAGDRERPLPEAPPRRGVALLEVAPRPGRVGLVAQGEHGARHPGQQGGGPLVGVVSAVRDVPGADQHLRLRAGHRAGRRRQVHPTGPGLAPGLVGHPQRDDVGAGGGVAVDRVPGPRDGAVAEAPPPGRGVVAAPVVEAHDGRSVDADFSVENAATGRGCAGPRSHPAAPRDSVAASAAVARGRPMRAPPPGSRWPPWARSVT